MEQEKYSSIPFRLHAASYGHGQQIILAFHGFGQDRSVYQVFDRIVRFTHKLHSFDLPFHGKSQTSLFKEDINKDALKDFFQEYFKINNISYFTLIGYSIGAKFALNLVNFFPEQIERLILIAPDGLKINFWYRLATGTSVSRSLFHYIVRHPGIFYKLADVLTQLKLLHPSVSRFAKSQMADEKKRLLVYNSWVNFRTLNLDIKEIGQTIKKFKIPVEIFLGEKDQVINPESLKPLIKEFSQVQVHMLPAGHFRLVEDTAAYFEKEGF